MKRSAQTVVSFTLAVLAVACAVPDGKKCVGGYHYDSEFHVCLPDKSDVDDTDSGKEDGGDIDLDAGCKEAHSFTGINKSCTKEEECKEYDADFCLVDPLSGQGGCVLTGCDSFLCPCEFTCCDCKSIGFPMFCVPDDVVAEMESYTCQCN